MKISEQAQTILKELEERDAVDMYDGTPKERRVRCITRTVGELLHILVLIRRPRHILELGTSAGYSTIWLGTAASEVGAHVTSVERTLSKWEWAKTNIARADLQEVVDCRLGDALAVIDSEPGPFDFVFMDHGSALYLASFRALRSKLSGGSVIIADGWETIQKWKVEPTLAQYAEAVVKDREFVTFLAPIEKGELIVVRL